jgi:hypothetical protein
MAPLIGSAVSGGRQTETSSGGAALGSISTTAS